MMDSFVEFSLDLQVGNRLGFPGTYEERQRSLGKDVRREGETRQIRERATADGQEEEGVTDGLAELACTEDSVLFCYSPLHIPSQVALYPRLAGIGRLACLLGPLQDRTWEEVQGKAKS